MSNDFQLNNENDDDHSAAESDNSTVNEKKVSCEHEGDADQRENTNVSCECKGTGITVGGSAGEANQQYRVKGADYDDRSKLKKNRNTANRGERSERKRVREKKRRVDINKAFEDLQAVLAKIVPSVVGVVTSSNLHREASMSSATAAVGSVSAGANTTPSRVDLVALTIQTLEELFRENVALRARLHNNAVHPGELQFNKRDATLLVPVMIPCETANFSPSRYDGRNPIPFSELPPGSICPAISTSQFTLAPESYDTNHISPPLYPGNRPLPHTLPRSSRLSREQENELANSRRSAISSGDHPRDMARFRGQHSSSLFGSEREQSSRVSGQNSSETDKSASHKRM